MTDEEKLIKRARGYACRYVNETDDLGAYPTDARIATACEGCVRTPRPDEYEAIRASVINMTHDAVWLSEFRRRNDLPMTIIDRLVELSGERVRVTWRNGCTQAGDVGVRLTTSRGLRPGFEQHHYVTHRGSLVGGEFLDAVKIERMKDNGRYELVWEQDPAETAT
jgi:hypothetical protein